MGTGIGELVGTGIGELVGTARVTLVVRVREDIIRNLMFEALGPGGSGLVLDVSSGWQCPL